jgi:hypothetical protein
LDTIYGQNQKEKMNVLKDHENIQNKLFAGFPSELLDLRYSPHAFGSGLLAFKVKGRNIQFVHDGRDNHVEVSISDTHVRYPTNAWIHIWNGISDEWEKSIEILHEYLAR